MRFECQPHNADFAFRKIFNHIKLKTKQTTNSNLRELPEELMRKYEYTARATPSKRTMDEMDALVSPATSAAPTSASAAPTSGSSMRAADALRLLACASLQVQRSTCLLPARSCEIQRNQCMSCDPISDQ